MLSLFLAMACNKSEPPEVEDEEAAEVNMLAEGVLHVLMSNNVSSYYIQQGQPRGFEYEMLRLFCQENKLTLDIKIIKDFEFLFDSLASGAGDLAAGNITITKERKERFNFTPEILRTRMVLIQRTPKGSKKLSKNQIIARMVKDPLELDGKTVYVNGASTFYDRLSNFAEENGLDINLQTVTSEIGTDELIRMVSTGEIDYTIADENVARIHKGLYNNIDISVAVSLSQSIAWAVPKGNETLQKQLTDWVNKRKNTTKYNAIYNKYFGKSTVVLGRENYAEIIDGQISPYDKLIQKHAKFIDWDWLLLAALINKESKFNPQAESRFGARGLMQIMPVTAERFGVSQELVTDPELNIRAGTRFLQWLDKFWSSRVSDPTERQKFVLASYNSGQGHVLDGQKLAVKYGLDPQKWDDNVELMMQNKTQPLYYQDDVVKHGYCNCVETVVFVKTVLRYYDYYSEQIQRYQPKTAQMVLAE